MDRHVQYYGGDDEANLYRPFVPERSIAMTKALQPLKDKIALVVGGSRGIGAGIARRLAEDGADIALTYAAAADKANELVQQITAGGVRAVAIKADSGTEAELRDAVAKTMQQFGRLDILVVNAGVL